MSGQTAHGQTFSFGGTAIPHIIDVQVRDTGNILKQVVADQAQQLKAVAPGDFGFTVNFLLPTTTPATILNAIKSGTTGAIACTSAGVDYDAASGISGGFTESKPSNGWVTVSAVFEVSGSVTIAAAA